MESNNEIYSSSSNIIELFFFSFKFFFIYLKFGSKIGSDFFRMTLLLNIKSNNEFINVDFVQFYEKVSYEIK